MFLHVVGEENDTKNHFRTMDFESWETKIGTALHGNVNKLKSRPFYFIFFVRQLRPKSNKVAEKYKKRPLKLRLNPYRMAIQLWGQISSDSK